MAIIKKRNFVASYNRLSYSVFLLKKSLRWKLETDNISGSWTQVSREKDLEAVEGMNQYIRS